jgi:RhoGEF domain
MVKYARYVNNYDNALRVLTTCQRKRKFRKFIKVCCCSHAMHSLYSYLTLDDTRFTPLCAFRRTHIDSCVCPLCDPGLCFYALHWYHCRSLLPMQHTNKRPELHDLTLQSFLILPIQRLPRYVMLIKVHWMFKRERERERKRKKRERGVHWQRNREKREKGVYKEFERERDEDSHTEDTHTHPQT